MDNFKHGNQKPVMRLLKKNLNVFESITFEKLCPVHDHLNNDPLRKYNIN